MTTFVFGGGSGVGVVESLGGIGDTGIVLEPVFVVSTDETAPAAGDAIAIEAAANNSLQIHGTVHGDLHGIRMGLEVAGGQVFVGDTGNVSGSNGSAILGDVSGSGDGGRYTLTNNGDISNHSQDPTIWFRAPSSSSFPDEGPNGGDYAITNNGLISNTAFVPEATAIRYDNVGFLGQIYNAEDGVISAIGDMTAAIVVSGQRFLSASGDVERVSEIRFHNAGEVYAEWYAYDSIANGRDHLYNTGILSGEVRLGLDDDIYNGQGGEVTGNVLGGAGNDVLIGGALNDNLYGGADFDRIIGWDGDDSLFGGEGSDYISGGRGNDWIETGGGDATVRGGSGLDTIQTSDSRDEIYGGGDADLIYTFGGHDRASGGAGDDFIDSGEGNDVVIGGAGSDSMVAGAGQDSMFGGSGGDNMAGIDGNDRMWGGEGNDEMTGDQGADQLFGGAGGDSLDGGNNRDTLDGGTGNDVLTGGAVNDLFVFNIEWGHDTITDFANNGFEKIDLSRINGATALTDLTIVDGPGAQTSVEVWFEGQSIKFLGMTALDIDASDFIF